MTTLSPLQRKYLDRGRYYCGQGCLRKLEVNGVKGDNLHKIGEGTLVVREPVLMRAA